MTFIYLFIIEEVFNLSHCSDAPLQVDPSQFTVSEMNPTTEYQQTLEKIGIN